MKGIINRKLMTLKVDKNDICILVPLIRHYTMSIRSAFTTFTPDQSTSLVTRMRPGPLAPRPCRYHLTANDCIYSMTHSITPDVPCAQCAALGYNQRKVVVLGMGRRIQDNRNRRVQ